MLSEHLIEFIKLLYNGSVFLIFPAVILFYLLKDHKGLMFAAVTLAFFTFGTLTHGLIKSFDHDSYVWRYILWAINDCLWILIISKLASRDKTHLLQSCLGIMVVFPAPLIQLFRVIDRHFYDLSYSTYLYKAGLPLINTLVIVICYLPLFALVISKLKSHLAAKPQM